MRIATWNLNNRVGKVAFRPEAAAAASALNADLVALNEFYPQRHENAFRAALASSGFVHQVASEPPTGTVANRVLIASRVPIERIDLKVPTVDIHLPANVVGVRVLHQNLTIVAVRVPAYAGVEAPFLMMAWEWLSTLAASLKGQPAVLLGDLNVSISSGPSRGGSHFRSILESGWHRAAAIGPTYFGHSGGRSEIDHILATSPCALTNAAAVTEVGPFKLAGAVDAISDHAALVCDLTILDGKADLRH